MSKLVHPHPDLPDAPLNDFPWDGPAAREAMNLNLRATDQDGKALKLSELTGKPIVASFIFTRCGNPQMCPAIVSDFVQLQKLFEKAGLADKVQLVLISYDPMYDTPELLKSYGEVRGLQFTNAKMLRPEPEDFKSLLYEFQLKVDFSATGGIANHSRDLYILDSAGRYLRQYEGIVGHDQVLSDVMRLLREDGGL